jgi:hypothetical protein
MLWELEEADKALAEGDSRLARRYISKALEQVRCVYCHAPARVGEKGASPHFKGVIHNTCRERYRGRLDYERKHEIFS